jgi:hypothetical protein
MSLVEVEEEGDDSVVGDSEVEGVSGGEFHGEGRIEKAWLALSITSYQILLKSRIFWRNKQSGHVTSFHS